MVYFCCRLSCCYRRCARCVATMLRHHPYAWVRPRPHPSPAIWRPHLPQTQLPCRTCGARGLLTGTRLPPTSTGAWAMSFHLQLEVRYGCCTNNPRSPAPSRILSPSERKASRRALLDSKASGPSTPSLPSSSSPLGSGGVGQVPPEMQRVALAGVTLRVPQGALCAVIGRVGSGKSTLMQVGSAGSVRCPSCVSFNPLPSFVAQAILGELHPLRGGVDVIGSVAYVPQTPWVLSGTVRDNITFGRPFDADLYERVSLVASTIASATCRLHFMSSPFPSTAHRSSPPAASKQTSRRSPTATTPSLASAA